jgi:phenylacetate-CoA ligase
LELIFLFVNNRPYQVKLSPGRSVLITSFSREAMPLICFRANDHVRLLPPGLCDCGRDSAALWQVGTISRYDDMIKIKATNVWPQTVD